MRKLTKRERILLGTALVLYAGFFAWQGMVLPARVSLETAVRRKEQLEKLLEESPKAEAAAGGRQLPGRKLEPEDADAILQKLAEDTAKALVYGIENETERIGPYLTDQEGNPLVPEIENGYYMLIDRQVEEGWATGADILHRGSFNFTLGLYDTDKELLYFCEEDT